MTGIRTRFNPMGGIIKQKIGNQYLRKPDYTTGQVLNVNQAYYADDDKWVSCGSQINGNAELQVSLTSNFSSYVTIYNTHWHTSYTYAKGGDIVPVPKGLYYRVTNSINIRIAFDCYPREGTDDIDKLVRLPDYFSGQSLTANTPHTADDDLWIYLSPNTVNGRALFVNYNDGTGDIQINQSNGYSASSDKGSTLTFIPKGVDYRFLYAIGIKFNCLEDAYV